jgi:hypothetical protein
VTGSSEMCSWERPRLWVPTASPKSNNSCQQNLISDGVFKLIKREKKNIVNKIVEKHYQRMVGEI